MARIRSVKPEFCTSLVTAGLSRDARLFVLLLPTEADDEGRFVNSPKKLAGVLYPHDEKVGASLVTRWLKETEKQAMVCLYEAEGGSYGHIFDFARDQHPSRPSPSRIPPCPLHEPPVGDSVKPPLAANGTPAGDQVLEVGVGRLEVGVGIGRSGARRAIPDPFTVTDELAHWATDNHPTVNVTRETTQFVDHHRAKGSTFKDWNAAWRTWIRNAERFAKPSGRADPLAAARQYATDKGLA